MEVLLPNAEIMEGLYFLANAAKNIGDLFFFISPWASRDALGDCGNFGFIGNQS
jgi:hypothetical protein